jgi:RNA polymerase sigma factor (sigma-70 family)
VGPSPTLLPLITADTDLDPALERILQPAAERARAGDREARDALYRAFEPKLRRFARRIRVPFAPAGSTTIWGRDDVLQEGYLVFAGLFDTWDPSVPFGRYVLATFPWRLRDAVHRGVARRGAPPHARVVPLDPRFTGVDATARIVEQETLIDALVDTFEPPLDAVLRLHILERMSLTQAAMRMGISRRTITRHWQAIMVRLRAPDPAEKACTHARHPEPSEG